MGGEELRSLLCQGQTRKLLWLITSLFAAILLLQYVDLPNGNFLPSIFTTPWSTVEGKGNYTSLSSANMTSADQDLKLAPAPAPATVEKNHYVHLHHDSPTSAVHRTRSYNFTWAPESPPPTVEQVNATSSLNIESPPPIATPTAKLVNASSSSLAGNISPDPSPPIESPAPSVNPSPPIKSPPPPPPPPPPPLSVKSFSVEQNRVYTVQEMDALLSEAQMSTHSMVPLWSSKADQDLVYAKVEIKMARFPSKDEELDPSLYHNSTRFRRSYELMEKLLKVYVYKEGKKPIFHQPNLHGIYASEGWFMKLLESSKQFVTTVPEEAHLFYIPFSSQILRTKIPKHSESKPKSNNLVEYMKNYIESVAAKHPFWNRTGGADHFLVACHDWAPSITKPIMSTCVRALCNADVSVGFTFGRDVSLPETRISNPKIKPLQSTGGKPPSQRNNLAFFAGQMHGYLRPILLKYWGADSDMKVFGRMSSAKGNKVYISYMQNSKYCLCPRGYEVNSPRAVEAIAYNCVPVIISDNFIPPLFETIDWSSFAVFVLEKDIPRLKDILLSIPEERYVRMYSMVTKVQKHFLWHPNRPVKYDLFHMILHSVWYNRVFQFQPK